MNNIVKSKWYEALVEDCKDIITEAIFTSRWALVEGYHQLGERIVTENNLDRKEIYGKNILQGLAKSIGMSERTLYYAIQFYEKYPELDTVPEGKNISWHKLVNKYLPSKEKTKSIVIFPNAIPISVEDIVAYLKRAVYARLYFDETYETYKIDKNIVNAEEKSALIAHIEDDKLIVDEPENPGDAGIELKSEPNPEPNSEPIKPKDIIARLPLHPKKGKDEVPAYNLAMNFWKKIAGDNTNPDLNWMKREKVYAKKLIKLGLTTEDVLNIYEWRIQNDQNGFWSKKLYSLGIIFSHLSDWSVEAKHIPPTFEDFLKKNPELEYRNIDIIDAHSAYIKASLCKQALEKARRAGVVLTDKDFETLYKASKIKIDVFREKK